MGSSMTKTSPMSHYDHRRRAASQDARSSSNFSKEYAEYWKRPSVQRNSNFAVEKNAYSSSGTTTPSTTASTQYSKFSSFR